MNFEFTKNKDENTVRNEAFIGTTGSSRAKQISGEIGRETHWEHDVRKTGFRKWLRFNEIEKSMGSTF